MKSLVKRAFEDYVNANNRAESKFKKILEQQKSRALFLNLSLNLSSLFVRLS